MLSFLSNLPNKQRIRFGTGLFLVTCIGLLWWMIKYRINFDNPSIPSILSVIKIIVSGFAGMAFLWIAEYNLKLQDDPKVKEYLNRVRQREGTDIGGRWFAVAMLFWLISVIPNEFDSRVFSEIFSALNSGFLVLGLNSIEFYKQEPEWYNKKIFIWFRVRKNIVKCIIYVVLGVLIIDSLYPYPELKKLLIEIPDSIWSIIVLILFLFYLGTAFKNRNLEKVNYLLYFTLILAFIGNTYGVFFEDSKIFLSICTLIYVVCFSLLLLLLLYSHLALIDKTVSYEMYADIDKQKEDIKAKKITIEKRGKDLKIKNEKLNIEIAKVKELKRSMNHVIRGVIRNLAIDIDMRRDSNIENIHSRVETMLNLHNELHDEKEKSVRVNFKNFIARTLEMARDAHKYDENNFQFTFANLSENILTSAKIARNIASIIIELLNNAYYSSQRQNIINNFISIHISLEIEQLVLTIQDRAGGFEYIDDESSWGYGLWSVHEIARGDLNGKIHYSNISENNLVVGSKWVIEIPNHIIYQ